MDRSVDPVAAIPEKATVLPIAEFVAAIVAPAAKSMEELDKTIEVVQTCLLCPKKRVERGLCKIHYASFLRQKEAARVSSSNIVVWEQLMVVKGLVLPE